MQQRSPLAPPLGELAAKPTERVKQALSAPSGHLSHRERQGPHPSRLRRDTFNIMEQLPLAIVRFRFAAQSTTPEGKALGQGYHSRVWGFSQALLYLSADLWYTSLNYH